MRGHVVVIGGGLAGTTAALDAAAGGWRVTLLESRARLGGAVYSFDRDGLSVDTGQHVFLRCYSEYRRLLHDLGAAGSAPLQDRMDIPVLRPGRPAARLTRSQRLPAPLHLATTVLRYAPLTVRERVSALRAAATLAGLDERDPGLEEVSFGDWLVRHGQSERARAALWNLVAVPALNVAPAEASLAQAVQVFRRGLLTDPTAGDVGILARPLSDVHDARTRERLTRAGVAWHTGERVQQVVEERPGFTVNTAGRALTADAVVVAVPHRQAARLVPERACPDRDRWRSLGSSPIVCVHVRYDRRVTDHPFAAVLDSPVPWVFDRSTAAGCHEGQYLVVVVSAADREIGQPTPALLRRHVTALADLFPAARAARVLDGFVTREPHATIRHRPGARQHRPAAATNVPGLVLAGAWTDTGWPDTMEGAVRSGRTAAQLLGAAARSATSRSSTPGPQEVLR